MCLTIKDDATKQVAEEDIVVYKTLWKRTNESVWRGFEYKPHMTYSTSLGNPETRLLVSKTGECYVRQEVHKGFHSFIDLDSAVKSCGAYEKIVKMVIPKGAEYYKGTWAKDKCYTSSAIKTESLNDICV